MQDLDSAQILSNLPKSDHFCPNFASTRPNSIKSCLNIAQIQSIWPKSHQFEQPKSLLGDAAASPTHTCTDKKVLTTVLYSQFC